MEGPEEKRARERKAEIVLEKVDDLSLLIARRLLYCYWPGVLLPEASTILHAVQKHFLDVHYSSPPDVEQNLSCVSECSRLPVSLPFLLADGPLGLP